MSEYFKPKMSPIVSNSIRKHFKLSSYLFLGEPECQERISDDEKSFFN